MSKKQEQDTWLQKHWRPALAVAYLVICVFDFMIGPMVFAVLSIKFGLPYTPWKSLTLDYGGAFHFAMGGILGVYAWGRTKEKMMQYQSSSPYQSSGSYRQSSSLMSDDEDTRVPRYRDK